jgi:hypothetical protein
MLRFFTSLKTTMVMLGACIFFFFAGVIIIPKTMQLYTNIIDTILLSWLRQSSPAATWWVLGVVITLALLAVNTIVCTADSLIKRVGRKELMKALSPQVVHIGVLLILLGHFLTSVSGLRSEAVLPDGGIYKITDAISFRVDSILVEPAPRTGVRWDVRGEWLKDGKEMKWASVRPAAPSYYKGIWLVIKSADRVKNDAGILAMQTILMARRDPGVLWAGAGALVFAIGCVMIAITRRRE